MKHGHMRINLRHKEIVQEDPLKYMKELNPSEEIDGDPVQAIKDEMKMFFLPDGLCINLINDDEGTPCINIYMHHENWAVHLDLEEWFCYQTQYQTGEGAEENYRAMLNRMIAWLDDRKQKPQWKAWKTRMDKQAARNRE